MPRLVRIITVLALTVVPPTVQAISRTALGGRSVLLASGRVVGIPSHRLSAVRLTVLTWPTNTRLAVGEIVQQKVVARGFADSDGLFQLRTTKVATLAALASENNGFANLELRAQVGSRLFETFYPLGRSTESTGARTGRWLRGLDRTAPNFTVSFAPGARGSTSLAPDRGQDPHPPCLQWVLAQDLSSQWGIIGEVHQWGQWIPRDRFVYGASADSQIQIGFKSGSGGWGIQGSVHIGNSNGTSAGVSVTEADASTGYRVEGLFDRAEYNQVCTFNVKRQATRWDGVNVRRGDAINGLDGECSTYPAANRNTFSSTQDGWSRVANTAVTWSQGLDLGPIVVGTTSGYSSSANSDWTFKTGQQKTLCGNDAYITQSHRVFAGM